MQDDANAIEQKGPQSLMDFGFLYGFFKGKIIFRHNHHSIVLAYFLISFAANIYLTQFISHWFAISLVLTTVGPFLVAFGISIIDRNFFSSEEHIEIINQQQLATQGTKAIGTTEAISGQTLMYKEEVKTLPAKAHNRSIKKVLIPKEEGRSL